MLTEIWILKGPRKSSWHSFLSNGLPKSKNLICYDIFPREKNERTPLNTLFACWEAPWNKLIILEASQRANCMVRGVQKLPRTAFLSLPTRKLRVERGPKEVRNPVCGPLNTQIACWEGSVCRAWPCWLLHWATCSWWLLGKRFALVFTWCCKVCRCLAKNDSDFRGEWGPWIL